MAAKPILWHIPISHYSEKARWALDYKQIDYERREPLPGAHIAVAAFLTRGSCVTLPVLGLEGRHIGDSTAVIAALERAWPQRPLYPQDPQQRSRALALEEHFDEHLGPAIRRLAWYEFGRDRQRMREVAVTQAPPALARFETGVAAYARTLSRLRYRAGSVTGAVRARQAVLDALDRLERELGEGEYLVADSFSVADLTAASLFYPLVRPAEGPQLPQLPESLEQLRQSLADRRGFRWVREIFARHRRSPSSAPGAGQLAAASPSA